MTRPAWTRDPATPGLVLFGAFVVGGFVAIALGWRVAARTLYVALQVPALVSGALGGLALVALGAAFLTTQAGRRLAAQERAETDALLDEVAGLVAAVRSRS